MEIFDAIVGVFAVVGSMAAAFVAWLAAKTYRDLSPAGRLRRSQDEYMLKLSAVTRQIFELMHEFEKWVQRTQGMTEFPAFLLPTLKQLSKQLNDLLDEAFIVGLGHFVLGHRKRFVAGNRSVWIYYIAFRSSLAELADLQQEKIINEFGKADYYYGMVRLAKICLDYELADVARALTQDSSFSIGASLEAIQQDIREIMDESFKVYEGEAWDYMERP